MFNTNEQEKRAGESMTKIDGDARTIEDLKQVLRDIGIARFASRMDSGIIDPVAGDYVLGWYVQEARKRPLLSKLAHFIAGREDNFTNL